MSKIIGVCLVLLGLLGMAAGLSGDPVPARTFDRADIVWGLLFVIAGVLVVKGD